MSDIPSADPTGSTIQSDSSYICLTAKWGKDRIVLTDLHPATTILEVKEQLCEKTRILPARQKLIGIGQLSDDMTLSEIKSKNCEIKVDPKYPTYKTTCYSFILMGTPEDKMLVEPVSVPEVIDDFDLDFNAGSDEWLAHVATGCNLKKFTDLTNISIMNEPRPGKPLLVLDLDHTLLDFSSKRLMQASTDEIGDQSAAQMKRPFLDEFLSTVYQHYDLVVWSQTSWRWLEIKLIELGMLTNSCYKFCFVLDKTSMFSITSTKKDGSKVKHYVKPLQIIWSKFQHWNEKNTIHLDDLSRNFALNLHNGLKVSPYHRKSSKKDVELLGLARFLEIIALNKDTDFRLINLGNWLDVVSGKKRLEDIRRDTKSLAK
jgi:ubiquitin-like domain-containing CTD phosphatase 1